MAGSDNDDSQRAAPPGGSLLVTGGGSSDRAASSSGGSVSIDPHSLSGPNSSNGPNSFGSPSSSGVPLPLGEPLAMSAGQRVHSLRDASGAHLAKIMGLLAHDLRNPLAALSSNVGFLQMVGKELPDETKEAVEDLVLSVEALGRIVDSLEMIGHELSDRRPGSPSILEVASLLRAVRPPADRGAASHGVTIDWKLERAASLRVLASEQPFLASLGSLIHNALTVAPSASRVTVEICVEEGSVSFCVFDGGPELPEELRPRVFSAAGQAEIKSERRARYSRGLGLYAVARAAHLAGALLEVRPQASGSCMALVVPRAT
jgi:signal transduction histidine kinase